MSAAEERRSRVESRAVDARDDLPPDLDRLRAVETYLRLQLAAVQARIAELEDGRPARAAGPAVGWTLQLLPSPAGASPRGYLHRETCFIRGGRPLSREQARLVLAMPDVTACDACGPEKGL
ncbi:DUF6233 domain-containing protein [Streptomyces sp. ME19-01-6]|uniref:DUF6233 domain-containing protein n=1 Tax=Streptomyces sp. ME19-01-6 TaxID=3028686 RepID=UPI0029C9F24F|nr:DUF6233 domain-containing protein [Streptomyces sp. ME19-01-6]